MNVHLIIDADDYNIEIYNTATIILREELKYKFIRMPNIFLHNSTVFLLYYHSSTSILQFDDNKNNYFVQHGSTKS